MGRQFGESKGTTSSVESSQDRGLPGCDEDEGKTGCASRGGVLLSLVRRLSSGGATGSPGCGGGGSSRALFGCGAGTRSWITGLGGAGPGGGGGGAGGGGGGACSTTVSASGARSGRAGTGSRRTSRELSPSKVPGGPGALVASSPVGDDATDFHPEPHRYGAGGSSSSTSGSGCAPGIAAPVPQDWRRLVGSIRRKVRRKTTQGTGAGSAAAGGCNPSNPTDNAVNLVHESSYPSLNETGCTKNQDDFLKATMRIFLVVSPPMGRVQVSFCVF